VDSRGDHLDAHEVGADGEDLLLLLFCWAGRGVCAREEPSERDQRATTIPGASPSSTDADAADARP
jgi:hypothetical protein